MPSQAEPRSPRRVFVFDWDDTLYPTSWLCARQLCYDSPLGAVDLAETRQLEEIDDVVCALLEAARAFGPVLLVTNSTDPWVERTGTRFMPRAAAVVAQLPVVSARDRYEGVFPNDPTAWKRHTFSDVLEADVRAHAQPGCPVQIVSVGDGSYERRAVLHVREMHPDAVVAKSLKFMEIPTIGALLLQLRFLHRALALVAAHPNSLDLALVAMEKADGREGLRLEAAAEGKAAVLGGV